MNGQRSSESPSAATDGGAQRSVVVLPFTDRSAAADLQHLGSGIADEVRANLSRLEDLRVVPRASARALGKAGIDPLAAGEQLGVDAALSGTIRRDGEAVVVECRLADTVDDEPAWHAAFDTRDTSLFLMPEEISRAVADVLRLHLSDAQLRAIGKAGTRNGQAYEYYLKGRQLFFRSSRKHIDEAVAFLQRAVAEDPAYTLAYAGLADCYAFLFMYFDPRADNLKFAANASTHALALDRNLAEARAARGLAVSLSGQYDEAEREFEAAVALDPRLFEAHYFWARTCFAQGRYEDACEHYEAAAEIDRDDAQALTLLGFTYRTMGRTEQADEAAARARARLERLLALDPDDPRANYLLADALLSSKENAAALQHAEHAVSLDPDDAYTIYGLACIYGRLGRVDDGIATLRRAMDCGFGHRAWILNDSDLEKLRDDPRFAELIATMPLPEN